MIKMVVTDLDGTLLSSDGDYSSQNIKSLINLGDLGIIRVIATGRSPYSASMVIPDEFPIDYLVFSSGAGIIRWSDKSIIFSSKLDSDVVQNIIELLIPLQVDFMVHEPIPQNHCFHYFSTGFSNPDFDRRIDVYKEFCSPLIMGIPYPDCATQIIAILPSNPDQFHFLKKKIAGVKVIRATSPLDGKSIWMEIFPEGISKGHSIERLCNELGNISSTEIMAIGNDYNDIDMLNLTPHSFVVDNAPKELKLKFRVLPSNDNSGFSEAVKTIIE